MFLEEITAATAGEVIFKLLRDIGLEVASPSRLQKMNEFPDIELVFVEIASRKGQRVDPKALKDYISLCRWTVGAWVAWFCIASCIWTAVGMLAGNKWVVGKELYNHPFIPPVTWGMVFFSIGT